MLTRKSMRHKGNRNPVFRFQLTNSRYSHNLTGSQFPSLENGNNNFVGPISLQDGFMSEMG